MFGELNPRATPSMPAGYFRATISSNLVWAAGWSANPVPWNSFLTNGAFQWDGVAKKIKVGRAGIYLIEARVLTTTAVAGYVETRSGGLRALSDDLSSAFKCVTTFAPLTEGAEIWAARDNGSSLTIRADLSFFHVAGPF